MYRGFVNGPGKFPDLDVSDWLAPLLLGFMAQIFQRSSWAYYWLLLLKAFLVRHCCKWEMRVNMHTCEFALYEMRYKTAYVVFGVLLAIPFFRSINHAVLVPRLSESDSLREHGHFRELPATFYMHLVLVLCPYTSPTRTVCSILWYTSPLYCRVRVLYRARVLYQCSPRRVLWICS